MAVKDKYARRLIDASLAIRHWRVKAGLLPGHYLPVTFAISVIALTPLSEPRRLLQVPHSALFAAAGYGSFLPAPLVANEKREKSILLVCRPFGRLPIHDGRPHAHHRAMPI